MKECCKGVKLNGEEAPQGTERSTEKVEKLAKKNEESDDSDAGTDSDFWLNHLLVHGSKSLQMP